MSNNPTVVHWTGEDGRPSSSVELAGVDVTVFRSTVDNKVTVMVDTNAVSERDVRVFVNDTYVHGTPVYDIHDIERNFAVIFSDANPTGKK